MSSFSIQHGIGYHLYRRIYEEIVEESYKLKKLYVNYISILHQLYTSEAFKDPLKVL